MMDYSLVRANPVITEMGRIVMIRMNVIDTLTTAIQTPNVSTVMDLLDANVSRAMKDMVLNALISTNVLSVHTTAIRMHCAQTMSDHSYVHAKMAIKGMV